VIGAVLDTNVLAPGLRGFANPDNTLGELLRRWRDGQFRLIVSRPILAELRRTLATPYVASALTERQRERAITLLQRWGTVAALTVRVVGIATHPEDDLILATAVSARADYLVTGDEKLLRLAEYQHVKIVTPRRFLHVLMREASDVPAPEADDAGSM
jgi:uncharacterized protein